MFNKKVAANYVTSLYMDLFLLIKQLITKNKRSVYQNNEKDIPIARILQPKFRI